MSIIKEISQLNDIELLEQIIILAQDQIEKIKSSKRVIHITEHKGKWVARFFDGENNRYMDLGPRLTPAAVLRQSRSTPPRFEDFEIDRETGKQMITDNPGIIGRWEDHRENGKIIYRYYRVPDYHHAKTKFDNYIKLAQDTITLTYGFSVEAMEKIKKWEGLGHDVIYPD